MNQKGISLVEMLIALTLISLVGVLMVYLAVQNSGLFFRETAKVSQGLSINDASTAISDLIRGSSGVVSTYVDGGTTYSSGLDTIIVSLPSVDAQGNVIENTLDYAVITRDPSQQTVLRKRVFPNALSSRKSENQVLVTELYNTSFYYLNNSGVQVSPSAASKVNFVINLKENTGINSHESSSSGEVSLRND